MFVVHLFKNSSNSRRKDLERVRTNTQVSDMRIWHVDTSARLSAKGARGLGDLCYARTEVERRAHEMQTFLHELRKLKKCQRTLDTNFFIFCLHSLRNYGKLFLAVT